MTTTATATRTPRIDKPSIIRIAGPDEEDNLVDICRELHAENGYYFGLSEKKVRENLRRSFNHLGAMIPVIGQKGAIEALAYVSIEQFQWSDDWHLSEWFNYVRPDYRRSQHARELLVWERNQADNLRLILFIGVVSNIKLGAKLRLYRRVFGDELTFRGLSLPKGVDIDAVMRVSGVSGGYFTYRPKVLYSDPSGAASTPH